MAPRVVIVGAGFGGLSAARGLRGAPVEITLIDRNNFHTFQPLLYQVATAALNAPDVAYPVRGVFHRQSNVTVRHAEVTGIDWERRRVLVSDSVPDGFVEYDHLILAIGATARFFGISGAAEHSYPLYTLTDAVRLRNHVLDRFEAADADPSLVEDGALTMVVVGGGPTGVETAGALAELFTKVLRKDFPRLPASAMRVILIEATDRLLGNFSESSQRHALDKLRRIGVDVRLSTAVDEVNVSDVVLRGGERIRSHTLVWAAGVQARVLDGAGSGPGRIAVEPDLRVTGHPEAFAVGDVAGSLPQVAQPAIQGGRHAARQIARLIDGKPTEPFRYKDKGSMATIGRRAAVAELPRNIKLRGTIGWAAWLGLHLVTLIGFRNRAAVLMNWAWNYLTWDRASRVILDPQPARRPTMARAPEQTRATE